MAQKLSSCSRRNLTNVQLTVCGQCEVITSCLDKQLLLLALLKANAARLTTSKAGYSQAKSAFGTAVQQRTASSSDSPAHGFAFFDVQLPVHTHLTQLKLETEIFLGVHGSHKMT
jgi:hypothetical protein